MFPTHEYTETAGIFAPIGSTETGDDELPGNEAGDLDALGLTTGAGEAGFAK